VDAEQRVLVAGVEVDAARAHRIVRAAFDEVRQRAQPLLLAGGRHPTRPLFLAANLGDAGPSLRLFADGHAVAEGFAVGHHVVEELVVGIDHDRARCFLAVILDDVTLVGHRDRRLGVRRVRQQLLVARGETRVRRRIQRRLHASAEQKPSQKKCYTPSRHSCPFFALLPGAPQQMFPKSPVAQIAKRIGQFQGELGRNSIVF